MENNKQIQLSHLELSWPGVLFGIVLGYTFYPTLKKASGDKPVYQFVLGLLFGAVGYGLAQGKSLTDVVRDILSKSGINLSKRSE